MPLTTDPEGRLPSGWLLGVGWSSTRYSPQSGNPDVYHDAVDDLEETLGGSLPDELAALIRETQATSDPFGVEGPGPWYSAVTDFHHDPAWNAWLTEHIGEDQEMFLLVEDRERLQYRHRKPGRDGRHSTTCYAPVDLYLGTATERDVTRELVRGLYAYAASKRGWPAPPGMPAYQDG